MGKIVVNGSHGSYSIRITDVRVMTLLSMNTPRTRYEIAHMLKISPGEVSKSLSKLHRNDLVIKEGIRPHKYYATKGQRDIFDGFLLVCWRKTKKA